MASGNDTVLGTPVMNDKHFEDEIQGFEAFYRSTKTFSLLVGIGAVMLYSQQLPPQVCVGGGGGGATGGRSICARSLNVAEATRIVVTRSSSDIFM